MYSVGQQAQKSATYYSISCALLVAEARPSKFLVSLQKASVAQWLLPIRQMLKNVQFEIFSSDFRLTFQRLFSCFWFYI